MHTAFPFFVKKIIKKYFYVEKKVTNVSALFLK